MKPPGFLIISLSLKFGFFSLFWISVTHVILLIVIIIHSNKRGRFKQDTQQPLEFGIFRGSGYQKTWRNSKLLLLCTCQKSRGGPWLSCFLGNHITFFNNYIHNYFKLESTDDLQSTENFPEAPFDFWNNLKHKKIGPVTGHPLFQLLLALLAWLLNQ